MNHPQQNIIAERRLASVPSIGGLAQMKPCAGTGR